MKNQSLFGDYAIIGWPCHFFTADAQTKYNTKVEQFCIALPDGSTDLTRGQKLRLWLYSRYLNAYDLLSHMKQSRKHPK